MRSITLVLFICASLSGFGQDTLYNEKLPNGLQSMKIATGSDTFLIQAYPDGTIAAKVKYSVTETKQRYFRYYPNGNVMWQKDVEDGRTNGRASFYDEKGKLAAELMIKNDSIIDTMFLSKKHYVLIGKISYRSTIYGGMEREDGLSNVSHVEGAYLNSAFYTVKLNKSTPSQRIYKEFNTDDRGNFYLCLEKGDYGFFPSTFPIEKVKDNSATTDDPVNGPSMEGGWNLSEPLNISSPGLYTLDLWLISVGYAP